MWNLRTFSLAATGVTLCLLGAVSYLNFKQFLESRQKIKSLSFDDDSQYIKSYSPPISLSIYEQQNNEFILANVPVTREKYHGNGFYAFTEIRENGELYLIQLDLSDGAYRIVRQGIAHQVHAR